MSENKTNKPNKKSIGGLYVTLRPGEQLQLRDSDYVIQNDGVVTTRIHIFSRTRADLLASISDKPEVLK